MLGEEWEVLGAITTTFAVPPLAVGADEDVGCTRMLRAAEETGGPPPLSGPPPTITGGGSSVVRWEYCSGLPPLLPSVGALLKEVKELNLDPSELP